MVTPIVVILCFLFFGVSHVLWFSPQPGDPVNQGEDETHEGNSCISMMTPRCHMNDQENDCSDGSDDSADDQLLDDEPLEMPELFESVGNISYVPKEDAMPLPAPIERTYTKTYAGVFYVNVRYQLLTAVVSK